jgi:hypothetical protein
MRNILKLALAAAAFSAIPTVASAQVTNGGFEQPVLPPGTTCCITVAAPGSIPGWDVTSGDINIVVGTYSSSPPGTNLAYEGDQYLDLVGESGAGSIEQTIATVAGQTYMLTFAYSNNIFGGAALASANYLIASLGGVVIHGTASATDLDWTVFTGTFVGTGSDTLSFTSILDAQNGSVFLDGVSIAAVPEASTWAMMILGFGLAGAAIRRRRRKLAFA